MAIHKEGYKIIAIIFFLLAIINVVIIKFVSIPALYIGFLIASFLFFIFILRFFRKPSRLISTDEKAARKKKAQLCFEIQRLIPVFELHFDKEGRFWNDLSNTQWN